MLPKEKKEILDIAEFDLSSIKEQDKLYSIFIGLVKDFPNDSELGEAVRLLFTSNTK
jgi:hypothetical protein